MQHLEHVQVLRDLRDSRETILLISQCSQTKKRVIHLLRLKIYCMINGVRPRERGESNN